MTGISTDYLQAYRGKRVLVTGGLGFLGSSVVLDLVSLGARVTVVDNCSPLFGANEHNLAPVRDQVDLNVCDIRDVDAMNHLVRGQDILFHIGMQTSHVDSMTDPLWDIDINCRGNMVVYEAIRQHNPQCYVIYAGTRGQYGVLERVPVDEDHPMRPTDIYGVNKVAAEGYGFVYRAHGDAVHGPTAINCYGPRHQMRHGKYGILNWFVRLAMDGQTISLFGDGSQKRDYNYLDDAVDAFLRAGAMPEACIGKAFNLGSGDPRSLREITELVVKTVGRGAFELTPWPKEREVIETGDYIADFRRFQSATGWNPDIRLEEGLKKTVDFYEEHGRHYWDQEQS